MGQQNIEIFIAGKSYKFSVSSQEQEEVMRKATAELNAKIKIWQDKFPEKPISEIISMTALMNFMSYIALSEKMAEMEKDETKLSEELKSYLGNIDKNSR